MRKKTVLFLAVLIMTGIFVTGAETPKDMYVFIRIDDLFMINTDIHPQEIDAFLDIAEKHGARTILSTIPKRLIQKTNHNGKMTEQIRNYDRRGHQIAQHGYDHRCPFTGRTDHEFFTPDIEGFTSVERLQIIEKGRRMLEAVIGKKVITYVGPGGDGFFTGEEDRKALYEMGFIKIPSADPPDGDFPGHYGLCMPGDDYTWAVTSETYQDRFEAAQNDFLKAAKTRTEWSVKFHDHFTRQAYRDGIVLQWLDEFLAWLNSLEEYNVIYVTFEDYYRKFNPGFSTAFD